MLIILVLLAGFASTAMAAMETQTFDDEASAIAAGWGGINNTTLGNNFGFSNTTNAGGPAGEAGGIFARTTTNRAMYVDSTLDGSFTQDNSFSASGIVNLKASGASNCPIMIGFANSTSTVSAHANYVALEFSRNGTPPGALDVWVAYGTGTGHVEGGLDGTTTAFLKAQTAGTYKFDINYDGATKIVSATLKDMSDTVLGSGWLNIGATTMDLTVLVWLDVF